MGEPAAKRSRAFVDVPVTDGIYYMKMMVTEPVAAAIIGKGGSNLRAMQEMGGAVKISGSGVYFPTSSNRPVSIGGAPHVVGELLQIILDRQVEASVKPPANGPTTDASVLNLLVPNCTVSRLIGPGGEVRNEMCSQTGAKLSARDRIPGVLERVVSLSGSPEQIYALAQLVMDKMNLCPTFREGAQTVDYRHVHAGAPTKGKGKGAAAPRAPAQQPVPVSQHGYGAVQQAYGGSDQGYGGAQHYPVSQHTAAAAGAGKQHSNGGAAVDPGAIFIPVDGSMVGGFIGRGGTVIKSLISMSGAKISILPETQQVSGMQPHRLIRISGDTSCVQVAHAAVAARLQELLVDPNASFTWAGSGY